MGQALYRKYRPKSLADIAGQDHITTTLKNALKSGKISHAYLFTGPKGVGKTSIARILAHEVNNFNYDEQASQLDIVEIDAASNRRIDEIRDLRDKVHTAPTSGKYKVYIIDEVHMLTKEAFNALLKTLEEPPAHVIFILATTESHKLPDTIISRTQRFSFKPIDDQQLVDHLKTIAKQEKITISDEALQLIAEHSDGSFRDSISLLDQASSGSKEVTLDQIRQLLGIAPQKAIKQLAESLSQTQPQQAMETLAKLEEQGFQAASIAKQLAAYLRQQLIYSSNQLPTQTILKTLKRLIAVPASPSPDKLLEVILLDIIFSNVSITEPKPQETKAAKIEAAALSTPPAADPSMPVKKVNHPIVTTNPKQSRAFSLEVWPQLLDDIKVHHNTLYGILRMSQPSFQNGVLTLSFKFAFHQKRLKEPTMQQVIATTLTNMDIEPVTIVSLVDNSVEPPVAEVEPVVDMSAISNIFGDTEMLES